MGYTTDFEGKFNLDRALLPEHSAYLAAFSNTRRMKRDAAAVADIVDELRDDAGLPVGDDGGYFVGAGGLHGQDCSSDVVAYNLPPNGQPGLWCQWEPDEGRTAIEWNGAEKFYSYVEWLEYLIEHFIGPWGYELNGEVAWQGEEPDDRGVLCVKGNKVQAIQDRITSGP